MNQRCSTARLLLTAAAIVSAGHFGSSCVAESNRNVLFLAVDDMKDWVNCLGGYEGTVHTPNIDGLASEGVLFTNAHCPSPKCAPSRAAIMTGMRASTTGLYDNGHWWLPNLPSAVTMPEHFASHGFRTAAVGKVFHHTAGNHPPKVWDEFQRLTFRNDPWFRGVKRNYPWSGHGPNPPEFPFSGVTGLGHENDWGSLPIKTNEYDDVLSADFAVNFLRRKHDKPFFLACGLFRPHLPWYVPQKYFDLYDESKIVAPTVQANDLSDVPKVGRDFAKARRSDLNAIRDAGKWKTAIRAYLASISFADDQLGRILKALRDSPYDQDTVVVLWSDHGWHLGEKQHWHKSTLWEEATRVPLVIRDCRFPPGRCKRPVSLIDLYPTLVDLCEIDPVESNDGVSLRPLLKNPLAKWNRPALVEFLRGNAAVRSERFRYIRYRDGGEELYDHQTDPYEWKNLANEKEFAHQKADLAKWLPAKWADKALTKKAFEFDHQTFRWTNKKTNVVTEGKRQ